MKREFLLLLADELAAAATPAPRSLTSDIGAAPADVQAALVDVAHDAGRGAYLLDAEDLARRLIGLYMEAIGHDAGQVLRAFDWARWEKRWDAVEAMRSRSLLEHAIDLIYAEN